MSRIELDKMSISKEQKIGVAERHIIGIEQKIDKLKADIVLYKQDLKEWKNTLKEIKKND